MANEPSETEIAVTYASLDEALVPHPKEQQKTLMNIYLNQKMEVLQGGMREVIDLQENEYMKFLLKEHLTVTDW